MRRKRLPMRKFRNLGGLADCLPFIGEILLDSLMDFVAIHHQQRTKPSILRAIVPRWKTGVFPELKKRLGYVIMIADTNRACRQHLHKCIQRLCEEDRRNFREAMAAYTALPDHRKVHWGVPVCIERMDTVLSLFQYSYLDRHSRLVGTEIPFVRKHYNSPAEQEEALVNKSLYKMQRSCFAHLYVCMHEECSCCGFKTYEPVLWGSMGMRICMPCKRNVLVSNWTVMMKYGIRDLANSKEFRRRSILASHRIACTNTSQERQIDPFLENMPPSMTLEGNSLVWFYRPSLVKTFGEDGLARMAERTAAVRKKFSLVADCVKRAFAQKRYARFLERAAAEQMGRKRRPWQPKNTERGTGFKRKRGDGSEKAALPAPSRPVPEMGVPPHIFYRMMPRHGTKHMPQRLRQTHWCYALDRNGPFMPTVYRNFENLLSPDVVQRSSVQRFWLDDNGRA